MLLDFIDNEYLRYGVFIVIVILAAFLVSSILRKFLNHFIKRYSAMIMTDPTNFSFVKNSVSLLIYTAAIIIIFYKIPSLRTLGTALFAGAGIFAAIIGFASQKAFSNIISGIFILIFKPFRVGDTVEFGGTKKGIVEEITLRHTVIKDYENRRILVPNSIISDDTIINSNVTDTRIRKHVCFGISYDSDIDKAIAIIQDEAQNHPLFKDVRTREEKKKDVNPVLVRVIGLSDFSVDLKAYVWTDGNDNAYSMMTDLHKTVKQRFDMEGVEIPFPYRTVVYKTDLNENREKKNA